MIVRRSGMSPRSPSPASRPTLPAHAPAALTTTVPEWNPRPSSHAKRRLRGTAAPRCDPCVFRLRLTAPYVEIRHLERVSASGIVVRGGIACGLLRRAKCGSASASAGGGDTAVAVRTGGGMEPGRPGGLHERLLELRGADIFLRRERERGLEADAGTLSAALQKRGGNGPHWSSAMCGLKPSMARRRWRAAAGG